MFVEALALILIVFVLIFVFIYNSLVSSRQKVNNAWSQIDVQLKKRADLIYNLVEAVKGYAKHERTLLTEVTEMRTQIMSASEKDDVIKKSNSLTKAVKTLFAVAESYPKLRANKNFLELQRQLATLENDIAYARMVYNDTVTMYNTLMLSFPQNLFSGTLGYKETKYLEANEIERALKEVKL